MNGRQPAGFRRGRAGRTLHRISVVFAVFGGLVLLAVMVLTVASVAGRGLLSRPLAGDFELVEIGVAVAIFAFLPYAQLVRGHIVVDLFTRGASLRTRAALELAGNLALTGIAGVLTWRLVLGGLDLARFREVTMVLAVPVWWGFVPAGLALALLTAVSAYTAWRSFAELAGGRRIETEG